MVRTGFSERSGETVTSFGSFIFRIVQDIHRAVQMPDPRARKDND